MTVNVTTAASTDSLLLSYDFNNPRSFTGPAITNLVQSVVPTGSLGPYFPYGDYGTITTNVPGIGVMSNVIFQDIQNDYPATSNDCCLRPIYMYGFDVSPSTQYTYGIVYKSDSGYTHPNFMYRYEYTGGANSAHVTEGGIFNDSTKVHLGGGWYYNLATFTTQPTTTSFNSGGAFYYNWSTGWDRLHVARYLITPGNYTSLHPRYWPEYGATLTVGSAIRDLTGTTTVAAANNTWNSAGAPVFSGGAQAIDLGVSSYSLGIRRYGTWTGWVKATSLATANATLISDYSPNGGNPSFPGNGMALRLNAGGSRAEFYVYPNNHRIHYDSTFSTDTWYHLTGVMDNANIYLYVNGVLVASGTQGESIGPSDVTLKLGNRGDGVANSIAGLNGTIGEVQVYGRALSSAEVLTLFNSQRGAYGV